MTAGQRFARLATEAVVRAPALWPLLKPLLRLQFERLAPVWDEMRAPQRLEAYETALAAVEREPRRALDVGTGTGAGAFRIARRWAGADVIGVDVAERMVAEARRKTPAELRERVRFEVADAARLPYPDASFDLVTLANMIPFTRELARVLAPAGHLVVAFSLGAATPIYVAPERLLPLLERDGFEDVAALEAGGGTALVARRRP